MIRKILSFFIVSMMLLVSGNLFAQNAQELRMGTVISVSLRGGDEFWYSIRVTEASLVTIETLGSIDTYLEVYDNNRQNKLMENDDGGSDSNARVQLMARPNTTYLVKLRGYSSDTTGSCRILASNSPIPAAIDLNLGTSYSGNISRGSEYWFRVRTSGNGLLTVETTSGIDTYLEAYDSNYAKLAENDDGGKDANAKIEIFTSNNQTYLFKLRGYGSDTSGPYSILAVSSSVTAIDLNVGTVHSGNISGGESYWFRVRASGSGLLTVETTGSTDTYLEAYDSNYAKLSENDDGGSDSNARIEIFTDSNQTYFFKLRGYSSSTTGAYRILSSFEAVTIGNNTERSRAVALRLGEANQVFLRAENEERWFSYRVTRDSTFVVQTRGDMDTILALYDSQGVLIAEDDDGAGNGNNAMITYRLSSGTYYIKVRGYSGSQGRCTVHAEIR